MDCYTARDVTERAKELAADLIQEKAEKKEWLKKPVAKRRIEKVRVHGWDTVSLDRTEIDLRYLEQIVDESQTAALAYIMQYVLERMADGRKNASELAGEAARKLRRKGFCPWTPKKLRRRTGGHGEETGNPRMPVQIPAPVSSAAGENPGAL